MLSDREDYTRPVGFAREPAAERRRWVARVVLALFVALIGWLLVNRVINPPEDSGPPIPTTSPVLPGPV